MAKSAVELAPLLSLGFYSRLFVVWKTSGSWSPVIDLSTLNLFVDVAHFRMETIQPVLLSVRQGDWMASIDLKEAYLQVPVHPDSRRFLRFVAQGQVYQFSALCFGLSTAPQVFSRVMAPVSRIRRNLFIHKARIPARRFSSSMYQHFKMFPPFASNKGYSASGLRYQSDVCESPTHYLILNSLAFARGHVILRSHFLILLLLIILISHYILTYFSLLQ